MIKSEFAGGKSAIFRKIDCCTSTMQQNNPKIFYRTLHRYCYTQKFLYARRTFTEKNKDA